MYYWLSLMLLEHATLEKNNISILIKRIKISNKRAKERENRWRIKGGCATLKHRSRIWRVLLFLPPRARSSKIQSCRMPVSRYLFHGRNEFPHFSWWYQPFGRDGSDRFRRTRICEIVENLERDCLVYFWWTFPLPVLLRPPFTNSRVNVYRFQVWSKEWKHKIAYFMIASMF